MSEACAEAHFAASVHAMPTLIGKCWMILLDAVLLDIGGTGVADPANRHRYVSLLLAAAPSKPVIS